MTVSPQWPQDGDRQQKAAGSGVESDSSSPLPVLPPTLFKLPNLNRDQECSDLDQPPKSSTSPDVETTTSSPATDPNQPTVEGTGPETKAGPENSETDAAQKRPTPAPFPNDQPAGRSWMETMGSHGVVLVLLLIVVGAALVSGRKSPQPGLDSLITTGQFDEVAEFDLPSPVHGSYEFTDPFQGSYESTNLASSADVDSPADDQNLSLSVPQGDNLVSSLIADGLTQTQPTETSNPPFADSNSSLVSLEPPQPSLTTAGESPRSELGAPQEGQLWTGPLNLDALAASKRFENANRIPTPPTLEDLGDQTMSRDAPDTTPQIGPTYRLSPTPSGIQDWSRYFPVYELRNAAGSGTSPTSN